MTEPSLASIRAHCADLLDRAAIDRHAAFHTPAVATADAHVRTMVLRGFDRDAWTLRFHTDARAPKAATIATGSPVGVLFYDKAAGEQLRIEGEGRIERDGGRVDAAWSSADAYARRAYLGAAPGTPADGPSSGLPDGIEGEKPTEDQLAPVRGNFAVLMVRIRTLDWYALHHDGHRRALFDADRAGRWVTP